MARSAGDILELSDDEVNEINAEEGTAISTD